MKAQPAPSGAKPAPRRLVIGLAAGAVAVAVIAIAVVALGGKHGGGGVATRDELVGKVLEALSAGDADRLLSLADPEALESRALDCESGNGYGGHKREDAKRTRRDMQRTVDKIGEVKLELVKIEAADAEHAMKKGDKAKTGCVLRYDASFQRLKIAVKATKAGKVHEQKLEMMTVELDGGWYLIEEPKLRSAATCNDAAPKAAALARFSSSASKQPQTEALLQTHCIDDAWEEEAIDCLAASTGSVEAEACARRLGTGKLDRAAAAVAEYFRTVDPLLPPPSPPSPPSVDFPGGLPSECEQYKADVARLASCDKLPQASRDALKQSMDAMSVAWKDYGSLPAEARRAMSDACKQGSDALKQAVSALCP